MDRQIAVAGQHGHHSDDLAKSVPDSASMPQRRARTKEISTHRPSPPSIVKPDRSDGEVPSPENSHDSRDDRRGDAASEKVSTYVGKRRSHHRRKSSAAFDSSNAQEDALKRSDSSSGKTVLQGHSGRRSWVPNSPSSAWLSRKLEKGNETKAVSTSPPARPSIAARTRSNSAVSSGATLTARAEASNDEASQIVAESPNVKNRFGRRSTHIIPTVKPSHQVDPLAARLQNARAAISAATASHTSHRDKCDNSRKREKSVESSRSDRGNGRRAEGRSLYKNGKDRSQEALNLSSETLASNDTGSTTRRSEGTLSKSRSTSRWKRRSLRSDSVSQEGQRSPASVSSNGSQRIAEDWDNDFIPRADALNLGSPRQKRSQTVSSVGGQAKEEGLPKRLGGWISNILNTSLNGEGNGQLSASQSSNTVRRKASTISLSLKGSSQGTASPLLAPIDTVVPPNMDGISSHSPAPKPRSAGLLSTLTNSSRGGRAESPSSISSTSTGARIGLDRALRYFLDHSEGNKAEEGKWLLGVWHGPDPIEKDDSILPDVEIIHATPKARESRSSTLDGDNSSQSRRGSDLDFDDNSAGSRRTRETSPSVASAGTRESSNGHKDSLDIESATKDASLRTPQSASFAMNRESSSASAMHRDSHEASFQADFSSRIWCTYRSHFVPITRDGTISRQAEMAAAEAAIAISSAAQAILRAGLNTVRKAGDVTPTGSSTLRSTASTLSMSQESADLSQLSTDTTNANQTPDTSTSAVGSTLGGILNVAAPANLILNNTLGERMGLPNLWTRATAAAQAYGLTGRAGLTTDAGWGCMLRTGQSVLANALLNVHLGRDWRRNGGITVEEEGFDEAKQRHNRYAKYVKLLSWFMDEPSLACPFGVHRMAREGKRLGKEVGEWFGPSTAGGAIKKLVDEYPAAGIGASLASDGVVYLDQVRAQSCTNSGEAAAQWDRPVLILIGIRLGLEGIHAMYHDSIKAIFTFPQSVGIAGGRPSSSYYFVGYQGNSLFYLDPHHVRASIPFRHPPPDKIDDTEWWCQAYSEAELSTFHTDRPRKMPMKTLDPSMLLGFLISDEASMKDFVERVKRLPRPIFSVLDSMPKWMLEEDEGGMHDEERALESFSEDSHDEGDGDRSVMTEASDNTQSRSRQEVQGADSKNRESRPNLSVMSHDTMTPRSESTFEIIDRAQGITISSRDSGKEGESVPIGSFTDIGNCFSSPFAAESSRTADDLSTISVTTSPGVTSNANRDGAFTWEEVRRR